MTAPPKTARDEEILGQPPRLAPVEDPPEELRQLFAPQPQRYGDRPKPLIMHTLMHHPAVARRFRPVPTEERLLPDRDQELIILRTAWLLQVPFIWGEHVRLAKACGFTAEEIARVKEGSKAPGWTAHERALLAAAEELRAEAMTSDATWGTLAETYDPARLIEVLSLIGQYQALGYIQNSLRIPLWEGNDGLAAG